MPALGLGIVVVLTGLMASTGLRVSETLALKVSDVEVGPRMGTLLVRESKGLYTT